MLPHRADPDDRGLTRAHRPPNAARRRGTAERMRLFVPRVRRPEGRSIGAWLIVAAMAIAAGVTAATTLLMIVRCAVPVPILDQWAQLVGVRAVTLGWLFSQHNEHRLFLPRLVFVLDRRFAAETGRLSLAASVLVQCGLAALLVRLARPAWTGRPRHLTSAASVVVSFVAWAVQYENYTWPFQVQFFGVLLAATGCFASVALVRSRSIGAAAAIGLAFVATFTFSSGAAVGFLAAGLAAWLRRSVAQALAVLVAASLMVGFYLIGYRVPVGHAAPWQALERPWPVLGYALAILGSPFAGAVGMLTGRVETLLAQIVGASGLAGLALIAASYARRRATRVPEEAALLTTCLFVCCMALLTGLGRTEFGAASALSSRYTSTSLVLWACLYLLAMLRSIGASILVPGSAAVVAFVVLTQPMFTTLARHVAANRAIAMPALVAGVADDAVLTAIYPISRVPLTMRLTEFGTRTGVFSTRWAPLFGTILTSRLRTVSGDRCHGRYDVAVRMPDPAGPGWRVGGTLARPGDAAARPVIALTDASARIVGFGIGDAGATTVESAGPAGAPARDGWIGAVAGADPGGVRAWVLQGHDTLACPLLDDPHVEAALRVGVGREAPKQATTGGAIDAIQFGGVDMLDGWAWVQKSVGQPTLWVDTDLPIASVSVTTVRRPDVAGAMRDPRLATAGFRLVIALRPEIPLPAHLRLCVWSEDRIFGARRLTINPATMPGHRLCPEATDARAASPPDAASARN